MYAAEVEKCHVEIHGGAEMFQRFAESETQPSKAAKMCSHAQIGGFDVAGGNASRMRSPDDGCRYRRGDLGWGVPFWTLTARRSVHFHQLREVDVRAEVFFDCRDIGFESVRRELEAPFHASAQVANEFVRTLGFTLSGEVGKNELRFAINRHPDVGVTPLLRVAGEQMTFFGCAAVSVWM